jgi:Fic family protein
MQSSLFGDASAGVYLSFGKGETAYRAFVPAPLPPTFALDLGVVGALSEADRALGELAGLGRTLTNPHLLIRPFLRREAVLSSRIEGTNADVIDVYAVEAEPNAGATDDAREVYNYVLALEYGMDRLSALPVSKRLIREIHEQLMQGVRGSRATPGEFRQQQNWIGPAGCEIQQATYVPPPVLQMNEALNALETYVHNEDGYPPLLRLAFTHYQFEAIHPFLDGNGRVGRLLIVLMLMESEILPLPLLYLSAYFERHRQTYYDLLLAVSERGAWKEWVVFFLRGVAEQARDALVRARRLQDLQTEWRDRLTRANTPARMLHVVDLLFETQVITVPMVVERLGLPYKTAQRYVEALEREGMIQQLDERGYGRTYYAVEILSVVSRPAPPADEPPRATRSALA